MIHIGLFEGIGGFSLAASNMGWKTLVTCEINPFGQRVLKYYWPNAYHHGDIKTLNYDTINSELSNRFGTGWRNDDIIITGGFPCQPYSLAGKRLGKADDRHLWPEMLRIIREVKPSWVVGENVFGLINWNGGLVFDEVQTDLETEGYEVQPYVLPACGVNAPHKRDRVWFVAHRNNESRQERTSNRKREGCEQISERSLLRSYPGPISEMRTITNSESQQSERMRPDERESCQSQQRESGRMGCEGNTEPDVTYSNSGRQSSKEHGQEKSRWLTEKSLPNDWENFPTQPPVRGVYDGISEYVVRIINPEIYGTINKRYTDKDLQKVWELFQSKEIQRKIGGLYKIHEPSLLLQIVQLCKTSNTDKKGISIFSEDVSEKLLRKMRKHKSFTNTPQGRKLEKQFRKQFNNSLPFLSHEVALVTMEIERVSRSFMSWHRNESIKAMGNAIVPQVALEIFKVIQQMSK